MTTKINIEVKNNAELLDKQKAIQAEQRQADKQKQEQKKQQQEAEKAKKVQKDTEDEEWKGAIADPKEGKKRKNRPKLRRCGHWIYKDYTFSVGTSQWRQYNRGTYDGPDIYQVSVGSGDGTQWATHYFHGPTGKPTFDATVTGSMNFVGYLSYVQFYQPGSGFGTVYTLPEGAIETPYDPMVYLDPSGSPTGCPDGFCWALYFPDELNSGSGRSRRTVTIEKKLKPVNSTQLSACIQNHFCFPVNNKKTVIIVPSWINWSRGSAGEIYSGGNGGEYVLHPQNFSQPSIKYTVYYKNSGGVETGWTPINGFYWIMDPADSTKILTLSQLGQLFPLDTTITHNYAGIYEMAGFVVSGQKVKKLDNIPSAVEAKIKARCPEPPWDDSNIYWAAYNVRDTNDQMPGYPAEIAEAYNNYSWMMNPDAHCMGVARNLFYPWEYDGYGLPYDYWNRDELPAAFESPGTLGVSPGAYDSYDADLQDHDFYNHFGTGSWYDSWDFTYSERTTWTSDYGEVRIHTQDISKNAWDWFYNIRSVTSSQDNAGYSRWHVTKNDIAWIYLNSNERQAFLSNYKLYNTDPQAILNYALSAPDNPEFNYMYYAKNDEENRLQNGVKWVSNGGSGSWVDSDAVEFDYDSDPFYEPPHMDPADIGWQKYGFNQKLSPQRLWPPSVSAGINDPIPADASLGMKEEHPLAKGDPRTMTLLINTAWDNDYSQVLLDMGFTTEDLAL